ncbi:MAG: hypothetical protein RL145_1407 [Pseudomonadota bacterium]|jgi:hypothetical protein
MEIVNGYMCRDCTDVSYAKKNIDPAHPKDGPQPSDEGRKSNGFSEAVHFAGALADLNRQGAASAQAEANQNGPRLNILA